MNQYCQKLCSRIGKFNYMIIVLFRKSPVICQLQIIPSFSIMSEIPTPRTDKVQHIMPDNRNQMFSCLHITFQQALCHNIIIIIRTGIEFSNFFLTQHLMSMIMMEPSSQLQQMFWIIQVFSLQALLQVRWSPSVRSAVTLVNKASRATVLLKYR